MDHDPVILLVEDNDDHAELVLRCLEEGQVERLRVFRVRHGDEALDFLHHRGRFIPPSESPTPNVVVLDLRMPRLDGFEFLQRVKADDDLRSIPVVVLTSSSAPADIARAYELHANSYLVKPTELDDLLGMLGALRRYWIEHNRVPTVVRGRAAPV